MKLPRPPLNPREGSAEERSRSEGQQVEGKLKHAHETKQNNSVGAQFQGDMGVSSVVAEFADGTQLIQVMKS